MGLLTVADADALALLADALAEYVAARDAAGSGAYETKSVAGRPLWRLSPHVARAQDAWRRAERMMVHFGLTPAARTRLRAPEQVAPSEIEEMMLEVR